MADVDVELDEAVKEPEPRPKKSKAKPALNIIVEQAKDDPMAAFEQASRALCTCGQPLARVRPKDDPREEQKRRKGAFCIRVLTGSSPTQFCTGVRLPDGTRKPLKEAHVRWWGGELPPSKLDKWKADEFEVETESDEV